MFTNRKVVPSYLNSRAMGVNRPAPTQHQTVQLLLGEVKEVIPPDSEQSLTKTYTEYGVDVQYSDGDGPITTVRFPNCLLLNPLAGIGDRAYFKLRGEARTQRRGDQTISGAGSKVLLLCVGGSSNHAYIIGGVRSDKVPDEPGQVAFWRFNGVSFGIDDEGQVKLQFSGPTKTDGSPDPDRGASEDHGPTSVEIQKDGSFEVSTRDRAQFLRIDHAQKKIEIQADDEWRLAVNGGVSIDAGELVDIQSAGVHLGAATDQMLLGTRYRTAQATKNTALAAQFTALAAQATAAGSALSAAAAAMAVPVAGAVAAGLGPMQAAAVALQTMVGMLTSMAAAISSFEASAATSLSQKNLLD